MTLEHRQVSDLGCFEAVVLGRAVYMGHWLEPARNFVECFGSDLAERQTWLFSSGPVGDPSRAPKAAVGAKEADYRDWGEISGWATEIAAQVGHARLDQAIPEGGG